MSQATLTLPEHPGRRRWTREEYYRLADLGFFEGQRVLLLEGEIIQMPAQGHWHAVALGLTESAVRQAFGNGFWVRGQSPLDATSKSDPEPDLAVVPGSPNDYRQHPTTALLVVEIADTSVRLDRRKAGVYAAAGVGDYWILNLQNLRLSVYRDPIRDATTKLGYRYQNVAELSPGQVVSPLAVPHAAIPVASLIPAQLLAGRGGSE